MKKVTDAFGIDNLLLNELSQRASNGKPFVEHLGSSKNFLHFDQLMFLPNLLHDFMLMDGIDINTTTIIGPKAEKPLEINTPMMITGITYGVVSKQAKIALSKASTLADTSANSGEGCMHLEERELVNKYVL